MHELDPMAVAKDHLTELTTRITAGEAEEATLKELDTVVTSLLPGGEVSGEGAEALLHAAFDLRLKLVATLGPLPSGYRGEFIASVAPGAMYADALDAVPASITIAQAIIESGWGHSAPGYNLFGMKGEGPAGSVRRKVVEYRHGKRGIRKDAFRSYHSFTESIEDHARVLANSPRYAPARDVAEDPAAYAAALQGKYATDPHYARKLLDLSARYALDRFDWVPATPPALADAAE